MKLIPFCKNVIKIHIILSSIIGIIVGIVLARQMVPQAMRLCAPGYKISRMEIIITYVAFSGYVGAWVAYECCLDPIVRVYNAVNNIGLYLGF